VCESTSSKSAHHQDRYPDQKRSLDRDLLWMLNAASQWSGNEVLPDMRKINAPFRPSFSSLLSRSLMLAMPVTSSANSILLIEIASPPLPVYKQPLCPRGRHKGSHRCL
jgi:hypothetical protein